MSDPPRPEVTAAVAACRRAGITIYMVTGDYGLTAEAIARRVGIGGEGPARVVSGAGLDAVDEAALADLLRSGSQAIFARVRPEHKLRVVATLEKLGQVVAVTELAPILAATFTGFPLVPLSALQVLSIDLGSDVLPALALGAERPEPGTMDRPPRPPSEHLFN